MLNNISWASYVIAISIFLCIYYCIVLVMYYRHDMQQYVQLLKQRGNRLLASRQAIKHQPNLHNAGVNTTDTFDADTTEGLLQELQVIIEEAAIRNFPKEELILALQLHLKQEKNSINNSSKETINQFIKAQSENYCSIQLGPEEERVLWNI